MLFDDFRCSPLCGDSRPYLLVEPARPGTNLRHWAETARPALAETLFTHCALLFRGFDVDKDGFGRFVRALSDPLDYMFRSTPRTSVAEQMYTATEYPARLSIPVHCENAYQRDWPGKIFFYCETAPQQGGATPLADISRVTAELDEDLKAEFQRRQVLYVRNYGTGLDLDWQTVFQTSERAVVEDYCARNGIEYEWGENGRLQTRQIRPAFARHPQTGQLLWFNQSHLFNVASLDAVSREAMLSIFKPDELPRNSYFGDGAPIPVTAIGTIQAAFERHTIAFPWRQGDILVADNMLVAHGRQPFSGPRKVLVMMGDLIEGDKCAA